MSYVFKDSMYSICAFHSLPVPRGRGHGRGVALGGRASTRRRPPRTDLLLLLRFLAVLVALLDAVEDAHVSHGLPRGQSSGAGSGTRQCSSTSWQRHCCGSQRCSHDDIRNACVLAGCCVMRVEAGWGEFALHAEVPAAAGPSQVLLGCSVCGRGLILLVGHGADHV